MREKEERRGEEERLSIGGKLERCDFMEAEHIRQDEDYEECSLDVTSKSLVILTKTFPVGW